MLTAEDFVAMGAKPTPATEDAPKVVYVTAKPHSPGSGIIGAMLFVAVILVLLGGAGSLLHGLNGSQVAQVATTIKAGAQRLISTPVIAVAPAPVAPAPVPPAALPTAAVVVPPAPAANVQVVPQGEFHAAPTAVAPTAVPAPVSAEVQAVYDSLYVKPTAIPLAACEGGAETYITTPVKVLDMRGFPIGEVRGRSCVSDQEAHNNATKLSQELMDKDKAIHPENWR